MLAALRAVRFFAGVHADFGIQKSAMQGLQELHGRAIFSLVEGDRRDAILFRSPARDTVRPVIWKIPDQTTAKCVQESLFVVSRYP